MESPVARKPKARREPLRLKSRRSPNKNPAAGATGGKPCRRSDGTSPSRHATFNKRPEVIIPASRAKEGVALRKTRRTTPVKMNSQKKCVTSPVQKGGWRFAKHTCAQSKVETPDNIINYKVHVVTPRRYTSPEEKLQSTNWYKAKLHFV